MCAKHSKVQNDNFEPIRALVENKIISHKEISDFANIDYPLFSLLLFCGTSNWKIFYIIFIEANFGDIYDHN